MTHFPRKTKGCYYHRVDDCCWLCWWRIAWAYIRTAWKLRGWKA